MWSIVNLSLALEKNSTSVNRMGADEKSKVQQVEAANERAHVVAASGSGGVGQRIDEPIPEEHNPAAERTAKPRPFARIPSPSQLSSASSSDGGTPTASSSSTLVAERPDDAADDKRTSANRPALAKIAAPSSDSPNAEMDVAATVTVSSPRKAKAGAQVGQRRLMRECVA